MRRSKLFAISILISLACLVTLACQANKLPLIPTAANPVPAASPTLIPSPTPTPTIQPTATPALSKIIELPTAPPSVPTLSKTEIPTVTPFATLEVNFDDLTPYRQAMLPEFAADVDTVAQAGASRYYLQVGIDPASLAEPNDPILSGVERVRYTNTENTTLTDIYFRLYPNLPGYDGQMTVEQVMVNGQSVKPELKAENSALRVPLPSALAPGVVADISLAYQVVIPRQTTFGYNIFSYEDNTLALADFYPAIAVYDDQGWDTEIPPEYGDATYLDVSLYQVELTVPAQMVVAASGSVLGQQAGDHGVKTLSLVSGPMRDFYITMRPDYQVVSEMVDGVQVNSYYPAGLDQGGQLALDYATTALRVYDKLFGPYPYAEFDVAATPTRAGGVEYPGMAVINQQLYNYKGEFFEQVVAHEVAHQWWYGEVGNDQIDEPWLDESLVNYSTVFYWEDVAGKATTKKIIQNYFEKPYEDALKTEPDRPVIGPVADFSERDYAIFVYGKGPLFFDALRRQVGDAVYLKIMQAYASQYKYKIAHAADLFRLIEQVSGQNIDSLIKTWLEDGQPN